MNPKNFQKILKRDAGVCYHCGTDDQTLIWNHRISRGMGGSKLLDKTSNLITLCSRANQLLEDDSDFAKLGMLYGWKLRRFQDPEVEPVYDITSGLWFTLDNNFGRKIYKN
jgi:hypothetical protein